MNNKALVTVIMPAWNAREHIEGSVRSVLEQSYPRLRLLVVDDGSTDDTAAVLARIAREDPRLLAVTVPNGGPAAARNRALDLLPEDTDYVMFIDSDDLLLPDALETALGGAESGADLVIFGFRIRQPDGSTRDYREPEADLPRDRLGAALPALYKANLLNQVWGKLFSARLLREGGIRFPDYRWGEDRLFVFDALERAQRVRVLPHCLYLYVMHRGESLITRYYDKKFDVCCLIDRRAGALCRELRVEDDGAFRYMFAKSVFSCLTNLFSASCPLSRKEKREAVRHICGSPQVREQLRDLPGGPSVRLPAALVLSGNTGLILLGFRALVGFSRLAPRLFTALKHRK